MKCAPAAAPAFYPPGVRPVRPRRAIATATTLRPQPAVMTGIGEDTIARTPLFRPPGQLWPPVLSAVRRSGVAVSLRQDPPSDCRASPIPSRSVLLRRNVRLRSACEYRCGKRWCRPASPRVRAEPGRVFPTRLRPPAASRISTTTRSTPPCPSTKPCTPSWPRGSGCIRGGWLEGHVHNHA